MKKNSFFLNHRETFKESSDSSPPSDHQIPRRFILYRFSSDLKDIPALLRYHYTAFDCCSSEENHKAELPFRKNLKSLLLNSTFTLLPSRLAHRNLTYLKTAVAVDIRYC